MMSVFEGDDTTTNYQAVFFVDALNILVSKQINTVFAEINANPEISAHQNSDFSKGAVHKTDGF